MGLEACLKVSVKSIPYPLLCYIVCIKAKVVPGFFWIRRQPGG
jgi:hypothetical protein